MNFQFEVAAPVPAAPPTSGPGSEPADLLRQLLEVQREQLVLMRMLVSAHDVAARWRAVLARWQQDFPGLPAECKQILPVLERAHVDLVAELANHLRQNGDDALDNEFALAEFLDRYGQRLNQLATLLNVVGPIAEVPS